MKKISIKFFTVILIFFSLLVFQKVSYSQKPIQIDFFYSPTCPHCAQAEIFFEELKKEYTFIHLNQFEISQNSQHLIEFYKKYNVPSSSQGLIPAIFIEKQYYIGFNEEISSKIKKCIIDSMDISHPSRQDGCPSDSIVSVPFIGRIDPSQFALPGLAILLGLIDGFNVCSLGALLIILALVLALKSRVKTLIFGSSFIIMTAVIYGLLIFFWYQLFSILTPFLRQMEFVIGILTIGGGFYFLKEYIAFRKHGPMCGIGPAQKIEGGFARKFKSLLENKAKTLTILFAILLFSTIITIVEFPCSAAVPVAFAGILTKAHLSGWTYIAYIILYIFFYMFDELLVFFIAFFTLKLWLTSPKFITWITLIESIIMFSLGLYYLFGL